MNFYNVQQEISDMLGASIMSKDSKDTFKVLSVDINKNVEDTDTAVELAEVQFEATGKDGLKSTLESFKSTLDAKYGAHVYPYVYWLEVQPVSNRDGRHRYEGKMLFMYSKDLEDAYIQKINI